MDIVEVPCATEHTRPSLDAVLPRRSRRSSRNYTGERLRDFFRFTLLRSASLKSAASRLTRHEVQARPRCPSKIGTAQPGSTSRGGTPTRHGGVNQTRCHGMDRTMLLTA